MNKKSTPFLSVIIPSYNEQNNYQRGCLDSLVPFLESQNYSYEIIFSDDGSTDQTPKLLEQFIKKHQKIQFGTIKLLKNPHGGKVSAVQAGMKVATAKWRLFTDFDQSTEISEVSKLLKYIDQDYGIIFGSRKINPGTVRAKWYRKFIGDTFNLITRIFTGLNIKDTQCGFKLFSEEASKLFDNLYVYSSKRVHETGAFTGAFDVELFVIARIKKIKYKEVPVRWQHYATNRVNIIKDSIRMFGDLIKIKIAKLRQRY